MPRTMNGIERIAAERQRQVEKEGWTPEHDDKHRSSELAQAAAAYALNCCDDSDGPHLRFIGADLWPWPDFWKPSSDEIRDLEKAGGLIAAEIDRLLRLRGESYDDDTYCIQQSPPHHHKGMNR